MGSYLNQTKTNNQNHILQELGVVYTPLIPALQTHRPTHFAEFKTLLLYMVISETLGLHSKILLQNEFLNAFPQD